MEEIWKEVKGHPGYYISNKGRLKSTKGNGHPNCYSEKILPGGINHKGYIHVHLSNKGKVKKYMLHRLVLEHFKPNVDNLPTVDHIDRNKTNNSLENLRWASYLDQAKNRRY